jgi:hypothetical protein
MSIRFLFLILFVTTLQYGQSVNDFQGVVIPLKYGVQKFDNQYRLQTISKIELQKAGFVAFYANESMLANYPNRCNLLYIEIKEENTFIFTKLAILLKDCNSTIIFTSQLGKSKDKQFDVAYAAALQQAFLDIQSLKYQYNDTSTLKSKVAVNPQQILSATELSSTSNSSATQEESSKPSSDSLVNRIVSVVRIDTMNTNATDPNITELYAQPTTYGYQLIDNEPKVVMKLYKTSNPSSYTATREAIQGVLVAKENLWFFEYYRNDQLISEQVKVKF